MTLFNVVSEMVSMTMKKGGTVECVFNLFAPFDLRIIGLIRGGKVFYIYIKKVCYGDERFFIGSEFIKILLPISATTALQSPSFL